MAAASAWSSTRASSLVLGMPMQSGSGMVERSASVRWVRVSIQAGQRTVESGRARAALPLRFDLPAGWPVGLSVWVGRCVFEETVSHLVKSSAEKSASLQPPAFCVGRGGGGNGTSGSQPRAVTLGAQNLQQVAPARLVGERKRRRPLEGVRVFANKGWVVSLCDGREGGGLKVCAHCSARRAWRARPALWPRTGPANVGVL